MANKKINQLVLKTTIQSTDLFPLGDPTTGQLFKKTVAELQAAIGGAVISVNGLVGTVVLDTDDIQELASPTNRYFTEARARAAISLTTTGSSGASTYSNSTGVLNVPTYTLAGLGGITASFLSGGTGITYNSGTGVISYSGTVFTDASIRALFSAGTGISYNSSTGAISYSGTVYTDASIRALISLTTSGSSGASTYNNTTGVLNVPTYTLAGLGGIGASFLSATAPIGYNSSTGVISISQANGTTNGFLSSTDWTTFNSKQNALTLGNVSEVVSNVLMFPDGGTNKTIGNLTIQVVQAGSTTNGFLSTTDWNTFNNKQNALTNPVTGTGTTNYVTKWTSSSAIGNSQIFDNGTNVGIGIASPTNALSIDKGTATASYLHFTAGTTTGQLATDGFELGINSSGDGIINQQENLPLRFYTNNTERFIVNSNGDSEVRSGLKLVISRSDNARALQLYTNNDACYVDAWEATSEPLTLRSNGSSGRIQLHTNGTERMRIHSNGNISQFANDASITLYKSDGTTAKAAIGNPDGSNTDEGALYLLKANSTRVQIRANGLSYIDSGNFLLGTKTDNGERLYVSGSIRATGSITANSDARLKKNIERIENALEKVGQISGYTYNTIYDEDRHAGVIAQEIDKVLPEIVNKGNDGLMGVEYGNISALLIEAIKDLKKDNESLQARLTALEK